jgi:hypothetical protein
VREKGKSICSTKAEGAVLCTSSPIDFVSEREQRLLSLTYYSTLFVGADIIISNPDYALLASSLLTRFPHSAQSPQLLLTQVQEMANDLLMHKTSLSVHNSGKNTNGHCTALATLVSKFFRVFPFSAPQRRLGLDPAAQHRDWTPQFLKSGAIHRPFGHTGCAGIKVFPRLSKAFTVHFALHGEPLALDSEQYGSSPAVMFAGTSCGASHSRTCAL